MAAVNTDVFWHLVKSLREIKYAAVFVSSIDKIIYDAVLVFFTKKIIKNNNFLVVHRKLFEWNDFIIISLNNLITNLGVDSFSKVLQKNPGIGAGAGFLRRGRFYQTAISYKSYSVISLFCQNYLVHKLASGKNHLANKDDLVCRHSWKKLREMINM